MSLIGPNERAPRSFTDEIFRPPFLPPALLLFNTACDKKLISLASQFMRRGEVSWKSFEDGFPNIMIQNVRSSRE